MLSRIKLLAVEKGVIVYILLTGIYLAIFAKSLGNPWIHFGVRFTALGLILLLSWIYTIKQSAIVMCVRYFLPFALLSYWYPETYYFNSFIFNNLDRYFVIADQWLFGSQPSLTFSEHLPYAWFSELMYFGYFSYYFIFFGTALWCYCKQKIIAERAVFLFVCSFFVYYIIFAIIPVVGPQFYFSKPLTEVPDGYIFCKIMRFVQDTGEKPTGAFPSSHVGITLIVLLFCYQYCRNLFRYVLPLFIILVFSTVYIKAHYVVDVIGGFVSAFLIYPLMNRLYDRVDGQNLFVYK